MPRLPRRDVRDTPRSSCCLPIGLPALSQCRQHLGAEASFPARGDGSHREHAAEEVNGEERERRTNAQRIRMAYIENAVRDDCTLS